MKVRDGEFDTVRVNGRKYVWPAYAPMEALLDLVAEQEMWCHPNRYLWGPTDIAPGDVVLDIGACEGSFSAHAAERGGVVIAVEPSLVMGEALQLLFRLRGLKPPTLVRCLLGDDPGPVHFLDSTVNPGASRVVSPGTPGGYEVEMRTLDHLVDGLGLRCVDFIKCDAEGADVRILRSGARTLARHRPKLAICTYHGNQDYQELSDFLRGLGYHVRGKGLLNAGGTFRTVMLHAW